ncbi:MAG: class I SAM-dependent methyltransferase [Oscillospiraceae bacterium]|nr:class I SAM-dependent methyltransferase [Oscillospiraceae bacterium]
MNTTSWNYELARTWEKFLPPIRPYQEEIEIFRALIYKYLQTSEDHPNVLILGSTPELRDLVCSLGLVPTVVDYSKENYVAMGTLKKTRNTTERFVESDWLEFESDESFDIILSEAALNVVDARSSAIMYRRCSDLLKSGGYLLAKNWIRVANGSYSVEDLIASYRTASNYPFGFYSYSCIPLMLCFYDYDGEVIYLREFSKRCRELFEANLITQREWESIAVHKYENVDLQLYIPSQADFRRDIEKYFVIEKIYDIETAFSEFHPIFALSRR